MTQEQMKGIPASSSEENDVVLNPGETYVGLIGDIHGNRHHTILLPGDHGPAIWVVQMEWAKSIGGDLPNRIEQAMLWTYLRDQFEGGWYWSNETHHSEPEWAWCQGFYDGQDGQDGAHITNEFPARAVRRVPA